MSFFKGVTINTVVQYLTYSDVLMVMGWGLVSPIIAVFITEQVKGGSLELVGLSTTVYFLIKSLVQVPIARFIDLKHGEKDDFWCMIAGSFLISIAAFAYIWVKYPWQVYVVQIINALGSALSYAAWQAIFTRHIDKHEEGLEWSLYYTSTDLAGALAAALGSLIAAKFGYYWVFLLVGIGSLGGTMFLIGTYPLLKKK